MPKPASKKVSKTKTVPYDVAAQLQRLMPKRFVALTPYAQLQHFPRYLKARALVGPALRSAALLAMRSREDADRVLALALVEGEGEPSAAGRPDLFFGLEDGHVRQALARIDRPAGLGIAVDGRSHRPRRQPITAPAGRRGCGATARLPARACRGRPGCPVRAR